MTRFPAGSGGRREEGLLKTRHRVYLFGETISRQTALRWVLTALLIATDANICIHVYSRNFTVANSMHLARE